jgi:uncharacterized membrane protein YqaE (UPF0057 family)
MTGMVLPVILSVLLPPLAVFLRFGIGRLFWIDLALTIIAWAPGVIFALVMVLRGPRDVPGAALGSAA